MARRRPSAEDLVGSLEYEVLRQLWHRFPSSVGDVLERINVARGPDDQLAYTTVMTVMARLHDKGILDREKQGRGYQYRPRFTEDELVSRLGKAEVERILDRFGGVALTHFAAALQDADPERLTRLVELSRGGADA